MPIPDTTRERFVHLYDEFGNPINAGNPLPVNMVAPPTAPDNVRIIDRFNADFLELIASLWDGAPLTLAQWQTLFDGDPTTFLALTANAMLWFKTPQQVDEIEFISSFASVPGTFMCLTAEGDILVFGPGAMKATPKAKISSFIFFPAVPPVNIEEIIIKSFTHTAIFPETDYNGKDETLLLPGGQSSIGFFPTMPKARIVGISKFDDGAGTALADIDVIQSFDGITDDYISRFPAKDFTVGNPTPGSGLGFSVEVIAPYARVVITNTGGNPFTSHRTFVYTRGAP